MVCILGKAMGNIGNSYISERMIEMDEGYFTIEASGNVYKVQKAGLDSKTKSKIIIIT